MAKWIKIVFKPTYIRKIQAGIEYGVEAYILYLKKREPDRSHGNCVISKLHWNYGLIPIHSCTYKWLFSQFLDCYLF